MGGGARTRGRPRSSVCRRLVRRRRRNTEGRRDGGRWRGDQRGGPTEPARDWPLGCGAVLRAGEHNVSIDAAGGSLNQDSTLLLAAEGRA